MDQHSDDEYKNVLSIKELADYGKYICEHDVEFMIERRLGSNIIEFDETMMYCRKCSQYSAIPKNWYLGALT
jgi:hypothetical protein